MVGLQVSPVVSKGCLLVASGLGVLAAAVGLDPAAAAHWIPSCLHKEKPPFQGLLSQKGLTLEM